MNKAVDKLECMKSKYGWFGLLSVLIVLAVFLYASFYLYSRIDCLVTSDDVCTSKSTIGRKEPHMQKLVLFNSNNYYGSIFVLCPSFRYI